MSLKTKAQANVIYMQTQNTVEPLSTDTSPLRTVFNVLTIFSYIFSKKDLYNTDSV